MGLGGRQGKIRIQETWGRGKRIRTQVTWGKRKEKWNSGDLGKGGGKVGLMGFGRKEMISRTMETWSEREET